MSSYDAAIATIKGEVTGEALISVWRHYPDHDLNTNDLVESTVLDYQKYPSDVVKLSPNGRYSVVDFGCKITKGTTEPKASGSTSCRECIVKSPTDWTKIEEIDPLDGHYGEQIDFVSKVSKKITDSPIMMTVFAPTMVARKLSANQFVNHYRESKSQELLDALKIIEKVTIEYARACLDVGANGLFIAIQEADKVNVNSIEETQSVLAYNEEFIRVVDNQAEFTVNHIHGDDVYFNEAINSIKTTAINWHDQTSNIDIPEARKHFKGGLFGGLDPLKVFEGSQESLYADLIELKDKVPLILAPGCVLLQGTPEKNIKQIFSEYKK
ncbi:MAG: hypothetical protein GPJ54_03015 [Candidatus Heimdallarchaeota archaeon]|nr:hypothetical protein [Candidatus Heimdallarchaeota archaeon]